MSAHFATVQSIYEAFGRGDVPAILEKLSDDVRWEQWDVEHSGQRAGVPWLQARRGKAGAGEFFASLAPLSFDRFEVTGMLGDDKQVAALVRVGANSTAGSRIDDEEIHLWTFDADGRVAGFRHYCDTVKQIAAAGL